MVRVVVQNRLQRPLGFGGRQAIVVVRSGSRGERIGQGVTQTGVAVVDVMNGTDIKRVTADVNLGLAADRVGPDGERMARAIEGQGWCSWRANSIGDAAITRIADELLLKRAAIPPLRSE